MSDNGKSYAMYKALQQVESLKRQRDQMRDALEAVMKECAEQNVFLATGCGAAAALKATEEGCDV